jgi:hypothetical protein
MTDEKSTVGPDPATVIEQIMAKVRAWGHAQEPRTDLDHEDLVKQRERLYADMLSTIREALPLCWVSLPSAAGGSPQSYVASKSGLTAALAAYRVRVAMTTQAHQRLSNADHTDEDRAELRMRRNVEALAMASVLITAEAWVDSATHAVNPAAAAGQGGESVSRTRLELAEAEVGRLRRELTAATVRLEYAERVAELFGYGRCDDAEEERTVQWALAEAHHEWKEAAGVDGPTVPVEVVERLAKQRRFRRDEALTRLRRDFPELADDMLVQLLAKAVTRVVPDQGIVIPPVGSIGPSDRTS